MKAQQSAFDALVQAFRENDCFVLFGHENPDPDSLGSMAGLHLGLQWFGKQSAMVCDERLPYPLYWPVLQNLQTSAQIQEIQTAVVLDCEPERTGLASDLIRQAKKVINIDHHPSNKAQAHIRYVDSEEPATASIVYAILTALDVPITEAIADALYGGIIGDTGGFRYANTTSDVLALGAELVTKGADPASNARAVFETKSWNFMSLLGHALSTMQRTQNGDIVSMAVRHRDFEEYGVDPNDGDQLVQYARMVEGVKVAILFRETTPGVIRLGLRSHAYDVGSLARSFGGGGHRLASGATLEGSFDQWVAAVISAAQELIDREDG